MNKLLKRILTVGASFALAAAVAVPAMAATDPVKPAPVASISVEKIMNTDEAGKFPLAASYKFTLTPTAVVPGRTITNPLTTMTMPVPADADTTSHVTTLTVDKDTSDTTQWTNTAAFQDITYTETGIYTYKLKEIKPSEDTPAGTDELGVTYDTATYFVNVYVVNVLNENGTPAIDSVSKNPVVTVSNITLYKTTNGTMALQADDFGQVLAKDNDTDAKITISTHDKTSTTEDKVKITAPLTNSFDTEDLKVSKIVTGDIADPDKEFTFTFDPATGTGAGVPPTGYEYKYQVFEMAGTTPVATDTTEVAGAGGTLKADTGNNTIKLKHKQYAVIYGLPVGLKYTLTETDATDYNTVIDWQNGYSETTTDHGTEGSLTGETLSSVKVLTDHIIKTTTKVAADEAGTRDNHAYYNNNKVSTTPTGVLLRFAPFVLLAALLVVGIVFVALNAGKRRKNGYQGL